MVTKNVREQHGRMGANANELYQKASLESTVSDFTGFTTREVTKNNQMFAGL